MTENDRWTRKLEEYEYLMHQCYNKGFMRIRYNLVLNSRQQLKYEDVRTTVLHLYRKIPTLRLSNQLKNGNEMWFRKMEKEKIEFQMFDESAFEEEFRKSLEQKFDIRNGPLWSVKLFPNSKECPIPEVKSEYPFQYNLLFCFQHTITDGTSNIRICNHFLNLLNDVIAGKEIDDSVQFGKHASQNDWNHIAESLNQEMIVDSKRLQDFKEYLEKFDEVPNDFAKAFGSPKSVSSTESVIYDFSIDKTNEIFLKCKAHGVTLNSFMSAAIHGAIYKMLQNSNFKGKSEYLIPSIQLLNIRRYSDLTEKSFGCFASLLHVLSKVKPDITENFWDHANEFDKEMKKRLNNFGTFEEDVARKGIVKDENAIEPWLSDDQNNYYNCFYITSNLGNLSNKFPGTGDHVQATYVNRTSSINKILSLHELHTFRGRLLYTIDYWSLLLTKENAKLWMKTIIDIIDTVLDQ